MEFRFHARAMRWEARQGQTWRWLPDGTRPSQLVRARQGRQAPLPLANRRRRPQAESPHLVACDTDQEREEAFLRSAVVAVSMRLQMSVSRILGRRRDYGPVVARRVLGAAAAKRKIRARSLGAVLERERSAAQHIISTGRLAAQADSQFRDLLLDVLRLVRTIERDSCAGPPTGAQSAGLGGDSCRR